MRPVFGNSAFWLTIKLDYFKRIILRIKFFVKH